MTEPQEPKKKKPWWMWVLGITGLGFVGLCFFCLITMILIVDPPLSDGSSGAVKTEPPVATEREILISAYDLCAAFENNSVGAEMKYEDKVIIVSGIIIEIGTELLGHPFVILDGGPASGVQCSFKNSEKNRIAEVQKGQRIRVKGKVGGHLVYVQLSKCEIAE